jgi:hypothetical protein
MEQKFEQILEGNNKRIQLKESFTIKSVKPSSLEDDYIYIDIEKNQNLYKDLILEKAKIFPLIEKNNASFIVEICLKYTKY